uniref:Uncharacterized protein n=1 Tax=Arundo donax TaxID=35708 RepID=A0A0A8ZFE4_ARUDO
MRKRAGAVHTVKIKNTALMTLFYNLSSELEIRITKITSL